jgi:hypothetical protein
MRGGAMTAVSNRLDSADSAFSIHRNAPLKPNSQHDLVLKGFIGMCNNTNREILRFDETLDKSDSLLVNKYNLFCIFIYLLKYSRKNINLEDMIFNLIIIYINAGDTQQELQPIKNLIATFLKNYKKSNTTLQSFIDLNLKLIPYTQTFLHYINLQIKNKPTTLLTKLQIKNLKIIEVYDTLIDIKQNNSLNLESIKSYLTTELINLLFVAPDEEEPVDNFPTSNGRYSVNGSEYHSFLQPT